MLSVEVCLVSGSSCSVTLPLTATVAELKAAVQQQLGRGCLRLVPHGQPLDSGCTLSEAGVRDGDAISAVVQQAQISAAEAAFALFVPGSSSVTWGLMVNSGDSPG